MKIKITLAVLSALLILAACNNSTKKPVESDSVKSLIKSLEDSVMDGHNIGMARMPKINKSQEKVVRILDSINKLPASGQKAAAGLKTEMEGLLKELNYAETAMDKWMMEFNYDSAANDVQQRIKYLNDEKVKVDKMKEAILSSLAKADTLLKKDLP